jgi:hypothetical protein
MLSHLFCFFVFTQEDKTETSSPILVLAKGTKSTYDTTKVWVESSCGVVDTREKWLAFFDLGF